ncbi:MAG: TetR/AcrR family transcriptional regulator [Oligoflexia bacterium]|nr:TetR/AcrR family transcriptional regulator [Oligoflexia bacterium]
MRTKGGETKRKLIEAGLELFYKNGVHWVSFQQVTGKVGLTQAAAYQYFEDKDELVRECCIHAAREGRASIDRHLDESAPARTRLKKYIEANLLWAAKDPKGASTLLAMYYFAFNSSKIRQIYLQINEQSVQRLKVHLEHGNNEGSWRITRVEETARMIHNILIGEIIKQIHVPAEFSVKKRVALCWVATEKLLR